MIDEGTREAKFKTSGNYWSLELPTSKAQWRQQYAVKDSWNDNGHYIEHALEDELKVWQGKTAGQAYDKFEGKKFYLEGGEQQLFIESGLLEGDAIVPKLTNWPDAL